jgi:putative membrane protein
MENRRVRNQLLPAFLVPTMVLLALPALAQAPDSPPEWYWYHHGEFGWGHMIFGTLMMLVFWGGLILLILLAVRWLGRRPSETGERVTGTKSALRILEQRFARGEIDKAEFEERKRLLSE